MDDFEAKLRKLPMRRPSPDLDRRVLGQRVRSPAASPRTGARIPLWGAAAAALLMGALGYLAGRATSERPSRWDLALPVARMEVILGAPGDPNPFDLTTPSDDFPAETLRAELKTAKGG